MTVLLLNYVIENITDTSIRDNSGDNYTASVVETEIEPVETDTLCGFSRCRAPLPGPGPRGGRPFAYCPDRSWPGGKTCKQLAAAQDALAEALGTSANGELTAATTAFTAAADQVAGPLGEVMTAVTALRETLAAELTAAAARVEQAETSAATERGLRQAAEDETRQAHIAAEDAAAEVRRAVDAAAATEARAAEEVGRHQADRDQAIADARAAAEQTTQAELVQARAEGAAATERDRAAAALRQVREERTRADTAAKALATATEKIAVVRAERDATRTALADLRAAGQETEDRLRTELHRAHTTNDADRARLDALADQLRTALADRDQRLAASAAEATAAHERLAAATAEANERAAQLARHNARLAALRDVLLAPEVTPGDLRTRLLAELLHGDPAP